MNDARRRPLWLLGMGAVSLGVAVASCGPSFQVVYEGDIRFEHCYAVDESATTPMREKSDCWREWMRNYTYGQTRDRVEYAAARYYALSVAPLRPTDEAMMEAAPGGGIRKNVISAPMPLSVYAPPPNTMPDIDAGPPVVDAGKPAALHVRPPGAECSDTCGLDWSSCREFCAGKSCDLCDSTYKGCMLTCVKDAGAPPAASSKPAPAKKK